MTVTHPYFASAPHPRVLAHRGLVTDELAARGVVENSFAAIQAAHDAGVTYIESDCHLTRDGTVVLFHDADLSRVTGDPRTVAEVTTREFEALMAERGGLATLQQALEVFPDNRFNIDVKAADAAVPAGRILGHYADRVLVTSFSESNRNRALQAAAEVSSLRPATSPSRAALLRLLAARAFRSQRRAARALADLDALQIPVQHSGVRILTPWLIDVAHHAGVEVHVWTINDTAEMIALCRLGVDGIVTDRADNALRALEIPDTT